MYLVSPEAHCNYSDQIKFRPEKLDVFLRSNINELLGSFNMNKDLTSNSEILSKALLELSVESWRFSRLFARLLSKLDAGEGDRYTSQYRYYLKRLEETLEGASLTLVNVEEQPYDPGVAATALNIGDFGADDVLVVDQMIEPIIMGTEGLVRRGTVMLRKVEL